MKDDKLEPLGPLRKRLRRELEEAEWRDDPRAPLLAAELQEVDELLQAGHHYRPKF